MEKTDKENTETTSRAAMDGEIGILARRRIEAGIIAPIYEAMREEIGEERAELHRLQTLEIIGIAAIPMISRV